MAQPGDSTKPHAFNPPNVPQPPPTYSQVSTVSLHPSSKLVTLAGQVGIDPATGNVPRDFHEQVKLAYANLFHALEAAGATPRDIIHVRHYIVKDTGDATVDAIDVLDRGWGPTWVEFMKKNGDGHLPPDTVVGVASLATKALLYEVEAWAIVSGGEKK